MKQFKLLALLFISLVFAKCTMQKRVYNSGYHVNWHKKLTDSKVANNAVKIKQTEELSVPREIIKTEDIVLASAEKDFIFEIVKARKTEKVLPNDSCGDEVIMKNGEVITVKVVEINQSAIKYRACNNLNGPLIVIVKDNVFMIRYANGSKEVISTAPAMETPKDKETAKNNLNKEWNWCAVASLICLALFFLFFTLIASAILAIIAQSQINKNPDKYKGKWMRYPGLVIAGMIVIGLLILIIAILVLLATI